MRRRASRSTAGGRLTRLSAAALLACACAGESSAPPNLLLVSLDTLRADHLGLYGYARDTSPFLDRLGARGVVFENAFATSPWTLPSHASLFTGLYPSGHGARSRRHALPDEARTLAEAFAARGFATGAVVSVKFLDPEYALDQGFASYRRIRPRHPGDNPALRVNEAALEWLDRTAREPFFLFLHYFDAHSAYAPAPEFREGIVRPYAGRVDGSTRQLQRFRRGELAFDPADRAHLVDLYDAELRELDRRLQDLFAALEARGLLAHTVVAITADHGEELFDHGGVLHAITQYDELLRVPLLFAGPGLPEGTRIATPVSLVDVLPTLAGLFGLGPAQDLDGRDLAPLWRGGGAWPERALHSEADQDLAGDAHDRLRSVRRGRWKLIVDRGTGQRQLFDLAADPGERSDLSASRPDLVAELEALAAAASRPRFAPRELPPIDEQERAQLRELGYAE